MSIWLAILGMAVVTLITRAAPLLLSDRLAPGLERWLATVPIAVFTALALRPLIVSDGAIPHLSFGAPLIAGLVGAVAAWRTGSVSATIVAGLAAYWLVRLL